MSRGAWLGAVVLAAVTLLLAGERAVSAQQQPVVSVSRMCSTPQGWCPVPPGYQIGIACYCLVPPNTQVTGYVVHCPWKPPADIYLNPHRPCQ